MCCWGKSRDSDGRSAGDLLKLAEDGHAAVGDDESARTVVFFVDADLDTLGHVHTLINDRVAYDGTFAHSHAIEEHRPAHMRAGLHEAARDA